MAEKFFDDPREWFKGNEFKTRKTKSSTGSISPPKKRGGSFSGTSAGASSPNNQIKKGADSISGKKKLPQVMVKISGSSKGCDKAQAHATYIGRNGNVELEDEQGIKFKGKEQKDALKSWEAMGIPSKAQENNRREAFHIVFSMPKGTNPQGLKDAVRNLVQEEFDGHKYFIAQHLDTDNPHCHVLLSASDDRGARLNPRKQDLHNYRVKFVEKLAEQGIEATASRRVHRFKHQDSKKQGAYHRDKRNGQPFKPRPTAQQTKNIEKTHKDVLAQYKEFSKNVPMDDETKKALRGLIKSQSQKLDKGKGR